ncbi:MAG: hypothetical protein N4A31_05010 [Rickettsiales bacterium]|jgi:F-type H+-transporting ATPase subunit b|nr:hypothetical protein [Rickettsiales bacterium]
MVFNESFWLAASIVIFVSLVFKYVKSFALSALSDKVQSIDSKFKEVSTISEEADALLKEYRLLHRSSKQKVKDILKTADLEIKQLREEAEQEVSIKLKARTQNILNKIHSSEQKVLSELRLEAVNLAVSASIDMLPYTKVDQQQKQFIKNSIDAISSHVKGNTLYLS